MTLRFEKITQTQFIPNAKPKQVYQAFLSARIHTAFTGSKATGASRVGAKFTAWDGYITGRNLELKSGKKIVQEWRTTEFPSEYPDSKLELTFKSKRGGTEIVMIHSKVPASQTSSYREGWITSYWNPLREYFSNRKNLSKE